MVESVMDKKELEAIVRETYGMYNRDLFEVDAPHVFRGWWAVLQDLPAEETRKIIQKISTEEKYLPTAGHIKNTYQKTRKKNPPPTPQQMWAHILTIQKNTNTGTRTETPTKIAHHPCVQATIQELGPAIHTLTTNQDRNFALEAYNRHTTHYLQTVEETP